MGKHILKNSVARYGFSEIFLHHCEIHEKDMLTRQKVNIS